MFIVLLTYINLKVWLFLFIKITYAGLWSSADGKLRTKIGPLSPQYWSPHGEREDLTPATQTTLATKSRLANLGSPSWNLSKIFSTSEIKVKGTLNARWNCKIDLKCQRRKI